MRALRLQIQYQPVAFGARAADQQGLLRRALFVTEILIAVIGFPLDDAGFAGAANAFAAQALDPGRLAVFQRLQDGHVFRHLKLNTRPGQHQRKGAARRVFGGEGFAVQATGGDAQFGGGPVNRFVQRRRAADVDMGAGLHVGQRACQIQSAVKTGDMATDVVGERRLRQLLLEGVVFLAVEAVVQMIALPAALQLVQMGHKRRDAMPPAIST